jgi:hypothetical protein
MTNASLASWIRNFGYWLAACAAVFAPIGAIGQATLFSSLKNAEIAIALFVISIALGFVVCCPFVCEKQARAITEREVIKEVGKVSVKMRDIKLDNWTWYISGTVASSVGVLQFKAEINAKLGKLKKKINFGPL